MKRKERKKEERKKEEENKKKEKREVRSMKFKTYDGFILMAMDEMDNDPIGSFLIGKITAWLERIVDEQKYAGHFKVIGGGGSRVNLACWACIMALIKLDQMLFTE